MSIVRVIKLSVFKYSKTSIQSHVVQNCFLLIKQGELISGWRCRHTSLTLLDGMPTSREQNIRIDWTYFWVYFMPVITPVSRLLCRETPEFIMKTTSLLQPFTCIFGLTFNSCSLDNDKTSHWGRFLSWMGWRSYHWILALFYCFILCINSYWNYGDYFWNLFELHHQCFKVHWAKLHAPAPYI